uniref:Uncharacterized protein n=1 Tax=Glossina pallidipes TaxID=7398 RepID=A0A1A9ZVA3_GLOPL
IISSTEKRKDKRLSLTFLFLTFFLQQKHIFQQKMGEIQTKLSPVRKERKITSDIKNLPKTKKEVNPLDYANQLFIASTLLILTVDCKMKNFFIEQISIQRLAKPNFPDAELYDSAR